jgi:chromate transporter
MDAAWVQLGLLLAKFSMFAFGGTHAYLGQMERELTGRGWITHQQFIEAYALSRLTPGSETLWVIPVGYHIAGVIGALVAFFAYFVPSLVVAMLVIALWSRVRELRWPKAIRIAVGPVAVGLTASSLFTLGRSAVQDVPSVALFAGVLLLLRTSVPTPFVVVGAGAVGLVLFR